MTGNSRPMELERGCTLLPGLVVDLFSSEP
ncbi:hypothetical protein JOE21_000881 [Desmospora profundinema]|uniref:Uncharacterized protein n=1 Tax=Desmospora profundinema TaxID=1571184 RepID=A0ABU1IM85_9BACL|nr:hypothetical protein [Desmospora profundinema]